MLHLLFEDNYLLALNKPAGLQVERDRFGNPSAEAQVADYLQKTYPWKKQLIAGVAHRLDRQVSGVLLFAKTPMALKSLGAQFEKRQVQKIYRAVAEGKMPEKSAELTHWLVKDSQERRAIVSHNGDTQAQKCQLKYEVLSENAEGNLPEQSPNHVVTQSLNIELLTGRYHQIRAQLSAVGCPIAGDEKYGGAPLPGMGICLHAWRLKVFHPKTGDALWIEAPPPDGVGWNRFL